MRSNVYAKTAVSFSDDEREIINAALRCDAAQRQVFYGGYPKQIGGKVNSNADKVKMRTSWLEEILDAITLTIECGECSPEEAVEWRKFCNELDNHINDLNQTLDAMRGRA